ncbi:hypothetical protein [Pseudalkalibacillus berkeleyi]|uniref:Uncharacterized protein n=1 Tax=Pseudalkalibacillus berkeleyi TaxID=1069813 RepID=A0ABS9GY44_9BACL|nr:hypothetical protein [Pseudalkalibacillus berkeleyi]MCF6136620.1 hypothetical protein [Pseudalkalibacillus berkeleyi]
MKELSLQIIFISGILYGFITFFIAMRKKEKKEVSQLALSISLIGVCAASFLMTIN